MKYVIRLKTATVDGYLTAAPGARFRKDPFEAKLFATYDAASKYREKVDPDGFTDVVIIDAVPRVSPDIRPGEWRPAKLMNGFITKTPRKGLCERLRDWICGSKD